MTNTSTEFFDIIALLQKHHYLEESDKQELLHCYHYLETKRANEQSLLAHCIMVAKYMAEWRFDTDAITAALFHDSPESDFEEISRLISKPSRKAANKILSGYRKICKRLELATSNSNFEQLSDPVILHANALPQAFYLVIAERIDLLSRCRLVTDEYSLNLAQTTREFLIPQIKNIHAYYLADRLEELCFQIENPGLYNSIVSIVKNEEQYNDYSRQQSIRELRKCFDKDAPNLSKELQRELSKVVSFIDEKRSIYSLQRFAAKSLSANEYNLEKLSNKHYTSYTNLTLELKDTDDQNQPTRVHDTFLYYYETLLKPKNFYLRGFHYTSDRTSSFYLLSDRLQNVYRLFVKTETERLRYFYGDIIRKDDVGISHLSNQNESKIKVIKPNGEAVSILNGATALDFAFMIHEDIGLHFAGGDINHTGKTVHPYTVLKNGDTVEIKKSKEITAQVRWFRYVKTDHALTRLINYFSSEFAHPQNEISVLTLDGTYFPIQANSTILDFAFRLHRDVGLHFDYALVNGEKVPISYVLQDHDHIVIMKAKEITASISWFRHMNSRKAKDDLIRYLKGKEG